MLAVGSLQGGCVWGRRDGGQGYSYLGYSADSGWFKLCLKQCSEGFGVVKPYKAKNWWCVTRIWLEVRDYHAYVPVCVLMTKSTILRINFLKSMKYINLKGRFLALNIFYLILILFVLVVKLKAKPHCMWSQLWKAFCSGLLDILTSFFCFVYYLLVL